MKKITKKVGWSVAALAAGMLPGVTFAQLDEIVVTATKREQTLQEVPVAVTVTSRDVIEKAHIQDAIDLQSVVPSLRIAQAQSTIQTNFIIRGFGNGANNVGIEPSVGVFIDGVYRSRTSAQLSDLPNLERIEVLRGPQNTLFGKGASAGVVSVVTAAPSFEYDGYIEATGSNFDGFLIKSYMTGPVSDDVAISIGGSVNKRDGYARNITNGNEFNERNRFGVRGQVLVNSFENVSLRIIADYDELDEKCCFAPSLSNPLPGGVGADPFDYETALTFEPTNKFENYGVSAHADVEFDNFTLTSIAAYRISDSQRNNDVDFSAADLFGDNFSTLKTSTFSQELRVTSTNESRFQWLGGAYFFKEKLDQSDQVLFGSLTRGALLAGNAAVLEGAAGVAPGSFFAEGTGASRVGDQSNFAFSFFGQADYEIFDNLTFTAGLNYTNDRKTFSLVQTNTDVFSNTDLSGINPALSALQFFPQMIAIPNAIEDGKSSDDSWDYTVRMSYDFLDDRVKVYAGYSTGFKATSWNFSRDSRPSPAVISALFPNPASVPFNLRPGSRLAKPENSRVIELGLKAQFDIGSINIALFDQAIKDFQTIVFSNGGFVFGNAEKQTARGVEIDFVTNPIEGLTLAFGGTYIDPEYETYTGAALGDLSGTRPGSIHKFSTSTAVTYERPIGQFDAFVRVDHQFDSEVDIQDGGDANAFNLAAAAVDGRTRKVNTFNASAGISYQHVDLSIWGRNLFGDEYLISNFAGLGGGVNGFPNQPETYGVTVRLSL